MNLDSIVSTCDVGSRAWHKDIAEQLLAMSNTVDKLEDKEHLHDLAEVHLGISKAEVYKYDKER